MKKKIIPAILAVALLFSGTLSILTIYGLQGNARIINYAGVVRGATQRLVKQELNGQPNDALISKLDGILAELATGEGENGLGRLKDAEFQALLSQMQAQWAGLKDNILHVRQGRHETELYSQSEIFFELADRTVTAAELYSERQVQRAEYGLIALSAVFLLLSALVGWYGAIQDRRQQALIEAENANRIRGEHLERLSEDLRAPMDEISELMYVTDPETHELLFINEAGRKTFGVTNLTEKKCYQALQGFNAPCSFCTTPLLVPGENYTWEYTNPLTKRHYLLKDRLIQWNNRPARLEIAFDTTEAETEKQILKNALDAEQMMMECVRTLYQEQDLAVSIPVVLECLGGFFTADRAYLCTIRDGVAYNDYEWCGDGIQPQKNFLQGLPLSTIARWLPTLDRQECMILEDIETIRENYPEEYRLLAGQNVHSLVAAPLTRDGQLTGVLGVDNPSPERMRGISSLLQTLCYFLLLAYRRNEDKQQLSHLSYFDTLTSFYNRNRYIEDIAALVGYEGPIGVVYLDVNGLKDVNDQQGHDAGDKLLVECTRQMREVFQEASFYRIGGDEFIITCTDIPRTVFDQRVSQLHRCFGADSSCHVAIGAQWAAKINNVQQLIINADAQMYEDKKEFYRKSPTSNRYRHHSDEMLHLSDPKILQEEISQNRFVVYFQPKISSCDGSVVGAEALIRYQPRSGTLMLPGNFLPILEESQSISQIDFYVFEYACSQLSAWTREGKQTLPVSVNFSRSSLAQTDFVARLTKLCQTYGVEKKCLEIELTETAHEPDGVDLNSLIRQLRQEGFLVSIDDFGTEYANLALLSTVDFDVLKLDKSLVEDIALNYKARTIVKSTVSICGKMQIQVVAEGVETEEQLSVLRDCGVELVQGFLFSKPVPIEEYENKYL